MSVEKKAMLQMALCASLWSVAGLFIGFLPWHPMVIVGVRSLFAAITVLIYIITVKAKIVFTKAVFLDAIFLSLTFICFVCANKLTTSANAILLQYTAPVFVMVFSRIFLKRHFKCRDIVAAGVTMCGIAVFFLESIDGGRFIGNALGIMAGVFMAAMFIAVGETDENEKISGILFGQLLTAALGLPFCFFTKMPITLPSIISIVVLGVFQLGIPYILLKSASKSCPPLAMCLISAIEPILNPVWTAIFAGVIPGTVSLIGGVIVIAGVTAGCIFQNRDIAAQNGKV